MPYLCIKTVSITPCNEDMSRVGKNVFPFSSYSSVVYIKKCLYLFCVCGTCIKCKTRKTQRCKEKGHSRIQWTRKRTLMREKEETTVLLHDKKNDIKLNAPA